MDIESLRIKTLNTLKPVYWLPGFAAGWVFFGYWMSLVGNPHVAETFVGFVIGVCIFSGITWKLYKAVNKLPS
ncbi:hypothetical protein SAMN04487958_107218 [Vreelandella subterranea]|uniref:Uncharacterized protein n=1 Tax=Vreelandella subterranea TaxID=416874 RepID=A0A1H9UU25_9GAMM|nr:hypothetical protein [Halomonas subterranea]SES12831.1 hypothetical protein SAMN04487958_107218 [Halomonas subterranea]